MSGGRGAALTVSVDEVARAVGGRAAALVVRVTNTGSAPVGLLVSIVGLDASWVPEPVRTAAVPPGATAKLTMPVTPPAGSTPGTYPCLVSVQPVAGSPSADGSAPSSAGSGAVLQETAVVVGDTTRLNLQLAPQDLTAVRSKRFRVLVDNPGPEPVDVELRAAASPGLALSLRTMSMRVPPRGRVETSGRAASRGRLTGARRRTPFTITAYGGAAPVRQEGAFSTRPVLAAPLTRVLAVLLVVALWAGAALIGLNALSDRSQDDTASGPARDRAAFAAQGVDRSQADAAAEGGGEGDGAAEDAADGAADGDAANPPGQLNGTVTARAPGGVRVTLTPETLASEELIRQAQAGRAVPPTIGKVGRSVSAAENPRLGSPSTTTQTDGSWRFADVESPGFYVLTFRKAGYQTASFLVDSAAATAPDADPMQVELHPGTGSMTGTVTAANGRPLGGAAISITSGDVTVTASSATVAKGAARRGDWAVTGLSTPGTYVVSAQLPGYGLSSRLVTLDASGSETVDLSLRRGTGTVTGLVSGAGGPLGGATVSVVGGDVSRSATTLTEGDIGAFTVPNLPVTGRPTSYTVTVSAPGHLPRTQRVVLSTGRDVVRISPTLSASTGRVTGLVSDGEGAAFPNAGLTLTGKGGTYKTMSASDGADRGRFSFNGVEPGSYVLSAEAFGHVTDLVLAEVTAGSTGRHTLTLQPVEGGLLPATAHIRGRVSDARTGGPIVCDPDVPGPCVVTATTVDRRPTGDRTFTVTAGPEVAYVLPPAEATGGDGLLPGLHTVTLSAPGYESASVRVQVPQGQLVDAPTVALYPSARITGVITTRVGTVPAGTCVSAVLTGSGDAPADCAGAPGPEICRNSANTCSVVAEDGSYLIKGLSRGLYDVRVTPPSGSQYLPVESAQLLLDPGDTQRYDAVLDRLARIRVLAYEPADAGTPTPLAGASVVVSNADGDEAATGTTGANGVVIVDGLRAGTYTVTVGSGEATRRSTVVVGLNQIVDTEVVVYAAGRQYAARVTSAVDGRAMPGATVTITGVVSYNGSTPVTQQAQILADESGCFAISGSGSYDSPPEVCGSAIETASVARLDLVVPVADVTIASGTQYRTKTVTALALEPGVVSAISLSAQPRPASVVLCTDASPRDAQASACPSAGPLDPPGPGAPNPPWTVDVVTRPAEAGTIEFQGTGPVLQWKDNNLDPGLAVPGRYVLNVSYPGYGTRQLEVTVPLRHATVPTADWRLDVPLKRLVGHRVAAVDAVTGQPVLGATFVVAAPGQATRTEKAGPTVSAITLTGLSPSVQHTVTVYAAGYSASRSTTQFWPGEGGASTTVGMVPLGAVTGTVTGTFDGGASQPLSGAEVVACPVVAADPTCSVESTRFVAVTAADGSYRISGSAEREGLAGLPDWRVLVRPPAGYAAVPAQQVRICDVVDAGLCASGFRTATADFSLQASAVVITVRVVDATGAPISGALVRLCPAATTTGCPEGTTGANGQQAFPGVTPQQRYALRVEVANYAPYETTLTPAVGVSETIEVALAKQTNKVEGVARQQRADGASAPLTSQGLTIEACVDLGSTIGTCTPATIAPDASYTIELLDGKYRLLARLAGHSDFRTDLTLARGQTRTVDPVLVMIPHTVTVDVVSANDLDLSGGRVTLGPAQAGTSPVPVPAQDRTVALTSPRTYTVSFANVPSGTYPITFRPPGAAGATWTESVRLGDDINDNPTVNIDVNAQRISLSATAEDICGSPSVSVPVAATPTIPGVTLPPLQAGAPPVTVHVPAAARTFTASAPSGYRVTGPVNVTAGAVTADVTFTATAVHEVQLTLLGPAPTSAPVAGASVTVVAQGEGGSPVPPLTTDAEGVVAFDACNGPYLVTSAPTGFQPLSQVVQVQGPRTAQILRLTPTPPPPDPPDDAPELPPDRLGGTDDVAPTPDTAVTGDG
jgi:hypothetical protein